MPDFTSFFGDLKKAWHDSALPGQPGYIEPEPPSGGWQNYVLDNDPVSASPTNVFGPFDYMQPKTSDTWYPGVGNDPVVVSPTDVGNPMGYGMTLTDEEIARKYQQQRELAETRSLGVSDEQYRNSSLYNPSSTNDNTGGGGGGGGTYSAAVQSPEFILSQDLSQRTPSGTQYAPDLSAYNDSSLFNYAGPGGLSEYTYGQGLPTQGADYGIWGTPSDMVNPYYEGQFATPQPQGPADGAINMPAVELPEGVPSTNQVINNSLNSGIPTGLVNRPPSTVFSSPGDTPSLTDRMLEDSPLTGLLMDEQLQNQINRDRVISDIVSSTDNSYVNPNEETLQAGIVPPYVNPNEETMQAGIVDEYTKGVLSGEIPAIDQVIAEYEAENAPVDRSLEIYAAAEKALANQTEEEKRWGFDLPRLKLDNRVDEFPMSGWGLIPPDEALVDKGEIGNLQMDSGLTWNNGVGYDGPLDNYIVNNKVGGFNQNQPTDIAARRNYLFNDDLDLGRPGDDSYVEFKPTYVPPAVSSGPPTRQAIPRITEPSIWDRVSDSFNRNFNLFGR